MVRWREREREHAYANVEKPAGGHVFMKKMSNYERRVRRSGSSVIQFWRED